MPIYDYEFKCPNGHTFRANAKLRTRCPECGIRANRTFSKEESKPASTESTEEPITEVPKKVVAKTVEVLRQGRERMPAKKAPVKPAPKKAVTAPKKAVTPVGVKNSIQRNANGLVKNTRVPKGQSPIVRKRPKQMAVARGTSVNKKPFWEQVAEAVKFW